MESRPRLAEAPTSAVPVYTSIDRRTMEEEPHAEGRGYKGRVRDEQDSRWTTREETLGCYTTLQLDAYHAAWELHQSEKYPRTERDLARWMQSGARS